MNADELLAIIKAKPGGLAEYELLNALYAGLPKDQRPNLSDSLVLFQQHFCLFHALYKLRDDLHKLQAGTLAIDVLKIQWLATQPQLPNSIAVSDPLREYYLNLENLSATDRAGVEGLLSSFWERLLANSEKHIALAVLDLAEPVTWAEVKMRYRQRLNECHPDKGGDHETTLKLNEAMAILKRCYRE